MEEKKSINISSSTLFLILALIAIIAMAYYIYLQKINTNNEISILETNAVIMQNTINNLKQKIDDASNTINNNTNIDTPENVTSELKLGTYQITEHIETEGPILNDVGVTITDNNLCSVYEGYGSSFLGTYSIENNTMICNTIIVRGEEGEITYSEGNIIFEFEIIDKNEIKLVNIINNSNRILDNEALKAGKTYKLSDANIKVLLDND